MAAGIRHTSLLTGSMKQREEKKNTKAGVPIAVGKGMKEGGKISVTKKISASSYMMMIANAHSSSQVSAVMRRARADAAFVKSSTSERSDQIKALSILERVVKNGTSKLYRLKKEQQMEAQKKLLEGLRKHEQANELSNKLIKKRRSRKAVEAASTGDSEEVDIVKETELKQADVSALVQDTGGSIEQQGMIVDVSL